MRLKDTELTLYIGSTLSLFREAGLLERDASVSLEVALASSLISDLRAVNYCRMSSAVASDFAFSSVINRPSSNLTVSLIKDLSGDPKDTRA